MAAATHQRWARRRSTDLMAPFFTKRSIQRENDRRVGGGKKKKIAHRSCNSLYTVSRARAPAMAGFVHNNNLHMRLPSDTHQSLSSARLISHVTCKRHKPSITTLAHAMRHERRRGGSRLRHTEPEMRNALQIDDSL